MRGLAMMARMAERLPQLLRTRHVALKTAWLRRLRARPPVSALARVEILSHYMDVSLGQLGRMLAGRGPRKADVSETLNAVVGHGNCPCGLNPLRDYYLTGAEALAGVLSELTDEERGRMSRCWHHLARSEIETLCSVCCRRSAVCPAATIAMPA